jgi:hypothetical protein
MNSSWKTFVPLDKGREYVAMLTYLPLKRYRKIPLFFRYTARIQGQLRDTPGAVGYALRAQIFTRQFWTLSVWDSDQALMDFVIKVPHGEAMKMIAPHMGETNFARWKLLGSDFPPKWNDAIARMKMGA